jgi:hypothetical protein
MLPGWRVTGNNIMEDVLAVTAVDLRTERRISGNLQPGGMKTASVIAKTGRLSSRWDFQRAAGA